MNGIEGIDDLSEVKMSQTLDATFDGSVFRPDQPIELEPNTRVRITIEPASAGQQESESFLQVALSLNLDGPADWSSRLDEYLYGGNGKVDE
jgi:predicted DNA-binding antitoxin AbrB/MazE fold protein